MASRLLRFINLFAEELHLATCERTWQPAVDVYRTRSGWLVKVELAGVEPDDVDVTVQGRSLSVRGLRRDCCLEEDAYPFSMEIAYSEFSRVITFHHDLGDAGVTAEQRGGMLLIRIRTEREE